MKSIQPFVCKPPSERLQDFQLEVVPEAVTRKAFKHLAKLPRGEHDESVIRSGRAAGLTIEQLIDWSDAETVSRSLAAGVLPWRDLWTVAT